MTDGRELMRLHVEALFTCDDRGRLLAVNEPGGGVAPRFFFGQTPAGNQCWFRHDVDHATADALIALCEAWPPGFGVDVPFTGAERFADCLSRDAPVRKIWAGPAYRFPADLANSHLAVRVTPANETLLSPYLDEWRGDVSVSVPMVAVLEDGEAVSLCCSVRMTADAHEAGVETHPDFRGRGHAARAVSAWAKLVRDMGRVPLYSTSWDNTPSRALAKKLGLLQFGADLHIT